MTPQHEEETSDILDQDVWEAPERMSDDDYFIQDGPGWRRAACPFRDQEDDE